MNSSSLAQGLFEPILEQHEELVDIFLEHQVALLGLDMQRCLGALACFKALLERHMAIEEDELMPAWRAQGGAQERLGPDLLVDEHIKLLKRLEQLRGALEQLSRKADLAHRDIIDCLDEELRFKRLLHHHDERERLGLYPFLENELCAQKLAVLRPLVRDYLTFRAATESS